MFKSFLNSLVLLFVFMAFIPLAGQDIDYSRKIAKNLSSEKYLGRGYIKNGVNKAAKYISKEFKTNGLLSFGKNYYQEFNFNVNTFPGKQEVEVNEVALKGGRDYLINPGSSSLQGEFQLYWVDLHIINGVVENLGDDQFCTNCAMVIDDLGTSDKDTLRLIQELTVQLAATFPVIIVNNNRLVWSIARETYRHPVIEVNPGLLKKEDTLELDIRGKEILFNSRNVIAKVEGTEYPDSFIVFTAHYDHLGMMGKDAIFNGANDNASGTAMILDLAKYYHENPAKYTTVFITFGGEEAGLIGSKYFVEHPLFALSRIKFLTNLDLVGFGEEGIMVVNGRNNQSAFDSLIKINDERSLDIKEIKIRGQASNSDHYWFAENEVPAIFIYTLGGNKAYHDIYDKYENLTFHLYDSLFKLLMNFTDSL